MRPNYILNIFGQQLHVYYYDVYALSQGLYVCWDGV